MYYKVTIYNKPLNKSVHGIGKNTKNALNFAMVRENGFLEAKGKNITNTIFKLYEELTAKGEKWEERYLYVNADTDGNRIEIEKFIN